ncbi:uncharacterized protein VTP21DRAFT_5267 [Calcarisporiella thermophila]|uniref:uncharacterized protein n=1 Tax=Calcarisporiella thermophila TaxID=911321 RepID=UPI003743AA03
MSNSIAYTMSNLPPHKHFSHHHRAPTTSLATPPVTPIRRNSLIRTERVRKLHSRSHSEQIPKTLWDLVSAIEEDRRLMESHGEMQRKLPGIQGALSLLTSSTLIETPRHAKSHVRVTFQDPNAIKAHLELARSLAKTPVEKNALN